MLHEDVVKKILLIGLNRTLDEMMMMIAFITITSSLVPLIEGLCAQIYFRFEIYTHVYIVHIYEYMYAEI